MRPLVGNIPVLSHFPSLIHFVHTSTDAVPIVLHGIAATCKQLIDEFMRSVSAHSGLIHVKLIVLELTSKGIITLIVNSPNLLTFQAFLDLEKHLRKNCLIGNYLNVTVTKYIDKINGSLTVDNLYQLVKELISLWR